MLFGLCDCNNFYVSCERVFRPDLASHPVAVLSNNDGCIIARSPEVKAMGVAMGTPFFREEGRFRHFGVKVFSSNYPLYDDMSRRVTDTLRSLVPDIEIYSIDEAFMLLDPLSRVWDNHLDLCRAIRERVLRWTGIPVSIGTGSTKTLAKAANRIAKTDASLDGVFSMPEGDMADGYLERIDIGDIWGVGFRNAPKLRNFGIRTASDLKHADDEWLRRRFSVNGARTCWELRGRVCYPFMENSRPRKSIRVSRSFGEPVTGICPLREAVTSFASSAAETLREQGSAAGKIYLFVTTDPFSSSTHYARTASLRFDVPTSFTPRILGAALACLDRTFAPEHSYRKAGVELDELVDAADMQGNLFVENRSRRETDMMKAVDHINKMFGRNSLCPASIGIEGRRSWVLRREHISPHYTTRWDELPSVMPSEGCRGS